MITQSMIKVFFYATLGMNGDQMPLNSDIEIEKQKKTRALQAEIQELEKQINEIAAMGMQEQNRIRTVIQKTSIGSIKGAAVDLWTKSHSKPFEEIEREILK